MDSSKEDLGTLNHTGIRHTVNELTKLSTNVIENADEIAIVLLDTPGSCRSRLEKAVRAVGVRLRPTYRLGDAEIEIIQRLDGLSVRDRPACELATCPACELSHLVAILAALVALAAEAASIAQQIGTVE